MTFAALFSLLYFLFPYIAYREMRSGRSLEPDAEEEHVTHGAIRRQGRVLLTWSLIAAGIALLSIFPLGGLPGGLLVAGYRAVGLSQHAFDVHHVVQASIYASVLWPIAIPAGVYLRQQLQRHRPERRYYWVAPAVVLLWLIVVGFILRLVAGG
jgi:hypothetical protein